MFAIGEVAKRSEIAASAIRYYETVGLLDAPTRKNGRRLYDESVFGRLAVIELAKAAGFSIAEIARLANGFSKGTTAQARWQRLARRKIVEIDDRIAQAKQMRRVLEVVQQCECHSLDECARMLRS